MIKSVHFKNFKALIDTTLPLNRFTLIVGPNGSGKSTAMQALSMFSRPIEDDFRRVASVGLKPAERDVVAITVNWALNELISERTREWLENQSIQFPQLPDTSLEFKSIWWREGN